jgi:hypothetical protein
MRKIDAIRCLGGTIGALAEAVGITPSAVSQWPDDLSPRLEDRVLAALARKHLSPELIGAPGSPPVSAAQSPADAARSKPARLANSVRNAGCAKTAPAPAAQPEPEAQP